MSTQETRYPLEFYICGTPRSLQAKRHSLDKWKNAISEAARQRVGETDELNLITDGPFSLTIYYFTAAEMNGDIDNIIKPIMDALGTIAYLDDKDVERVVAQKFEPQLDWEFAAPSLQLAAAFDMTLPFVYVRVDDDLGWRRL